MFKHVHTTTARWKTMNLDAETLSFIGFLAFLLLLLFAALLWRILTRGEPEYPPKKKWRRRNV